MKKFAVIDIGSLKVKLRIGETNGKRCNLIVDESKLTCLGNGLSDSGINIHKKELNNTIEIVKKYVDICNKNKTEKIKMIATESLRKAKNLDDVMEDFVKFIGMKPEIITQEEEAKIFYKAVLRDFPKNKRVTLVDMGGGSMQILAGTKENLENCFLLPLGVYFLQQKFAKNSHEDGKPTNQELKLCQKYIKDNISKLKSQKSAKNEIIYGSSNVLNLFKFIKLKLKNYTFSERHPFYTNTNELIRFLSIIKDMSYKQREQKYPFQWGYMWGIQMAFINVLTLAEFMESDTIVPSNVNIAEGYIFDMFENLQK